MAQATATSDLTTADQYLTFQLGSEEYGLEILKVREIIGIMDITSVPRTPDYVLGVINLRGNVIPVMDLRRKFEMEAAEHTRETCIIVVDVEGAQTGIVVDRVSDVLDIGTESIQDAPAVTSQVDTDFILGIGKTEDRVTILLDISRVLAAGDLDTIKQLQSDADADAGELIEEEEPEAVAS
jgi:purine-binding chemotaxis protein CheW